MSEDTMTAQEAADLADMSVITLRTYTYGSKKPRLKAKQIVVSNHMELRIKRTDFETWLAAYRAKPAFGAKLHKSRRNSNTAVE
jgi:hypothetical protein